MLTDYDRTKALLLSLGLPVNESEHLNDQGRYCLFLDDGPNIFGIVAFYFNADKVFTQIDAL